MGRPRRHDSSQRRRMISIATTTRRAGHCIDCDRPDVFVHREEENPGHGPFRGHDVPSELHTERDHRKWGNPPRQGPT